jgi:tetratricopeptide (TPR) repeat protein
VNVRAPEIAAPGEEGRDALSRIVAVCIVLVTLTAAAVGWRAASSSGAADSAGVDAQRLSVKAMEEALHSKQDAQLNYELFVRTEAQRRRAAAASWASLSAERARDQQLLEEENEVWTTVSRRTEKLTELKAAGRYGPEQDLTFPGRYYAQSERRSQEIGALRDAASEESFAWGKRNASYATLLTMLTVALFLLGFWLSVPGRAKLIFVVLGIALALAAAAWAATLESSAPSRPPERAAKEFAEGYVAHGTQNYKRAAAHLEKAVDLWPTYARAYALLSDVYFLRDAPETFGFQSVTDPQALDDSISVLRKADDLGLAGWDERATLGWLEFLLALRTADDAEQRELLEWSARHAEEAIDRHPGATFIRYNLGLARLALGQDTAARAAYEEAVRRTQRDDQEWLAALADLDLLLDSRPDLAAEVRAAKEFVAGSVARQQQEPGPWEGSLPGLTAQVYPSAVQVGGLVLDDFDSKRDVLSMHWYWQKKKQVGWVNLADVSGYVPGSDIVESTRAPGTYFIEWSTARCLERGQYRVEIYVNGRLAGEARTEATLTTSRMSRLRSVDVQLCPPAQWQKADWFLPGFLEGLVAPDEQAGTYVLRMPVPRTLADLPPERLSTASLDSFVSTFGELFPARPTFDDVSTQAVASNYFLGLSGSRVRWYEYDGGWILAGAGVTSEGDVLAGVVFGPSADFETRQPLDTFDSLLTTS